MPDQRLDDAIARPRLVRLARAVTRLGSSLRILIAGAHPDDEPSDLVALWSLGQGHKVQYVCTTRGQGGQNSIGTELGGALGVLRSAEMALAAERLGIGHAFLDSGQAGDPLADFGFSKSADDTLRRWGADEVLRRLVREIRAFRPDIVLPCFLDVAGQHGHHRAMTQTLLRAYEAAGDAAYGPDLGPVWTVAKLYLPAWDGSSESYDDEEPPPPATVQHDIGTRDPVTGLSYGQLGEWSRNAHASQGMGVWRESESRARPLHLARSRQPVPESEATIGDGLPATLADWGHPGAAALGSALDLLRNQFPIEARMTKALTQARSLLAAVGDLPEGLAFRLTEIASDLDAVADLLADGLYRAPVSVPQARPSAWVGTMPASALVNRLALRPLVLTVETNGPCPEVAAPPGWQAGWSGGEAGRWQLTLTPPADPAEGRHSLRFSFGSQPAMVQSCTRHPHVGEVFHEYPAELPLAVVSVALPQRRRVAVLDSGVGSFGGYLTQLGFEVGGLEMLGSADSILLAPMGWARRPDAAARRAEIFAAVAGGARLVTLYHRPWDNWDSATSAVKPLELGRPSVRWRVCEPEAPVTALLPHHPVLTRPNAISAGDWDGWVRERGLYFASGWDTADWAAPLSLSDPGNPPLSGGLLVADHGAGQQIHCSLAFHLQLRALVPGAIKLLVNLLSPD